MMSSSSATVRVEKATSDLLANPDWTINIEICDYVNTYPGQGKDVLKALKKRLQHKSPQVQFLALTLLETMVKNCGDHIHFQIAERNILGEVVKIVKKKTDMNVRDKILSLLDAWQEAFGGPGGKHPQYYYAYEELRRSGVVFPPRSSHGAPIFTPPVTHPNVALAQAGFGMPSNSSRRLDEAMAMEIDNLSLSTINSMREIMDLLNDMLQAVNPSDPMAVKDEVIIDLVNQCLSNQRRLMQMLTTTRDEELLAQGLELNDGLQNLLAKHDAIASGSPLPNEVSKFSPQPVKLEIPSPKQNGFEEEAKAESSSELKPTATNSSKSFIIDEDEEEDDFAQLARRHSKAQSSQGTSSGNIASPSSVETSSPGTCTALALPDPPPPVKTKEQDMIDLLSLALTTTTTSSPQAPSTPPPSQHMPQVSVSPNNQGSPFSPQINNTSQEQVPYNSYVVPWAQPRQEQMPNHNQNYQPLGQQQTPSQNLNYQSLQSPNLYRNYHPQSQQQIHNQHPNYHPQVQSQIYQPQVQPQYPRYSSSYPAPPWASSTITSDQRSSNSATGPWTSQADTSYIQSTAARQLQHFNSLPPRQTPPVGNPSGTAASGQKPFIPSYRLFEDLDVFGNESKLKGPSSSSPSLASHSSKAWSGK